MGGMKPKTTFTMKTGMLIALFSILVTAVFAGILFFSQYYTQPLATEPVMLYPLAGMQLQEFKGSVTVTPENITSSHQIYMDSVSYFMKKFLPLAIFFCFFVFTAFWTLWVLLKRLQQKQLDMITNSVLTMDTDTKLSDFPAFASAIEKVRRQYQDSLDDYKRLNSYLSHEQKNALAILRTNVELSPNPVYLRNLDNLTAGIDDILTLAETQGEEITGAVDVSLVCAAVCDSYRKLTDTISFDFDETSHTEVAAKQRWIYQAVSNLVDNAVKYGKGNPIEVSVRGEKHSVIVTVKDHGNGIAPEKQEQIFQNRYRVNEQHSDGYGIGLSLVSHVCDLCGGFVTLESESGIGTTFYLSFPQLTLD